MWFWMARRGSHGERVALLTKYRDCLHADGYLCRTKSEKQKYNGLDDWFPGAGVGKCIWGVIRNNQSPSVFVILNSVQNRLSFGPFGMSARIADFPDVVSMIMITIHKFSPLAWPS